MNLRCIFPHNCYALVLCTDFLDWSSHLPALSARDFLPSVHVAIQSVHVAIHSTHVAVHSIQVAVHSIQVAIHNLFRPGEQTGPGSQDNQGDVRKRYKGSTPCLMQQGMHALWQQDAEITIDKRALQANLLKDSL